MSAAARVGGFVAGLGVLFAAAMGVGTAVGPLPGAQAEEQSTHRSGGQEGAALSTGPLPGLSASRDGVTLVPQQLSMTAGRPGTYRFTVLGADGRALTAYEEAHGRHLRLVVVRRDLTGLQQLQPTRAPDGTWSVPLTLPAPGAYRVLADLTPRGAARVTLGVDLAVAGPVTPRTLPPAARATSVDGYDVTLAGDLAPGRAKRLTFAVTRGGGPVDLEPHLGAAASLVVLRAGDLAFLHTRPDAEPVDGRVGVDVTAPSVGAYRAFLEFRAGGRVHTAGLTVTAGVPG